MRHDEFVPQAIMLIGVPGSGKSTYIDKLKAQSPDRDYVVLSTDDVLELLGSEQGWDYKQAYENIPFKKVQAIFNTNFLQAVKDRKDIIIDQTNLTVKSRARKLNKLPEEYKKIAVVFNIDTVEMKKRLDKRAAEGGKSIPQHVLDNMIGYYVPPSRSEFDEIIEV